VSSDLRRLVTHLGRWLGEGRSLLLMTDYDGTLTPIVPDPRDASLPPAVRAHLETLARAPGVRVAVVSGRDLADVRRRVAVPEAIYAGCHGLEIEGPLLAFTHPEAEAQREVIRSVAETLGRSAYAIAGMRVEPKRLSVAVHYREVTDAHRRDMESELARAVRGLGVALKLMQGVEVVEILPHVAWNKGHCVLWIRDRILHELPAPVMVLFMGDDWTEENAFEALDGQAVTIRVAPDGVPSRADYWLIDVVEVQRLIGALAGVVRRRAA
jgi:trehalose-phosphatase